MLYNEEKLKSEEFFKQIKNRAQDMMIYDEVHEASKLITSLEQALNQTKDFKDKNYYLYVEYKKIITRLKWLVLNILTDDEVIDLFRNNFTRIYKIPDYDIQQKLKSYLLGFIVFQDRDNFKKELRQALLDNQEKLTKNKLIINSQEKISTVGNWILDYNSNLGSDAVDNIKRIQYFTNNKNIKNLNEEEKVRVKTLLDLYERLKLSSLTLEGLEEDIPVDEPGHIGIIRGGVFEPFKEEKIVYQPVKAQKAIVVKS
ncbi:MAG: hypothetical protein WC639_05045, partial [Patescibacteria group bacterium]